MGGVITSWIDAKVNEIYELYSRRLTVSVSGYGSCNVAV